MRSYEWPLELENLCMFLAPLMVSERVMGVIISPLHGHGLMDQQVHA